MKDNTKLNYSNEKLIVKTYGKNQINEMEFHNDTDKME